MDSGSTILVVCTGNVRRSPAIEAILRMGTPEATGLGNTGVQVVSAGTRGLVGERVDPLVAAELATLGVDTGRHRARLLTQAMVSSADLILAAERVHRAEVVRLVPSAVNRTFTLRELAGLGELVGREALGDAQVAADERLRELVRRAPLERIRRVCDRGADDLADLRRPSRRAARRLVRDLTSSVETILRLLEPESEVAVLARAEDESTPASVEARTSSRTAG